MQKYKHFKIAALWCLAGYFFVGLGTLALPGREVIPFYSWFLFAEVPNHVVQYDILILEMPDRVLPEPLPFGQAKNIVGKRQSISAHSMIQELGRLLESGTPVSDPELLELKVRIESRFRRMPVRYAVVRVEFQPLDRWREGEFESMTLVEFSPEKIRKKGAD